MSRASSWSLVPAGIRRCLSMRFLIRQSGSDFSGELESFPGSEDGDDFIDDGGSGNGTLYECRKLWPGVGQYAAYNPVDILPRLKSWDSLR
ncbi:hypothetical protein ACKX2L_04350 [Lachnospiraceae bacterium YH-ros2228]